MPIRVSATDRIRTKIDALFAEDRELPEILEEVARLGAQLLMQAALEADLHQMTMPRGRRQPASLDRGKPVPIHVTPPSHPQSGTMIAALAECVNSLDLTKELLTTLRTGHDRQVCTARGLMKSLSTAAAAMPAVACRS